MSPAASIHATAVAIGGEALLIRGPSRSGKSRLAVALIARSTRGRSIVLIGDDRILLSEGGGCLVARPHPRIAGFMERRGLGIVAMDWVAEAPVGGLIELGDAARDPSPACGRRWPREAGSDEGRPACERPANEDPAENASEEVEAAARPSSDPTSSGHLLLRAGEGEPRHVAHLSIPIAEADADRILAWWDARSAAPASHLAGLSLAADWPRAKD